MRFLFVCLFTFLVSLSALAKDIPSVNMDGLMKEIKAHDAKTMVIFWAPWCPFCMRELKIIRDNPQFVENNNLQIIGLSQEKDKRASESFVENEKMPFKFLIAKQEIYDKLQRIKAVPLTIVFSKEGKQLDMEYGKQNIEDLALMLED